MRARRVGAGPGAASDRRSYDGPIGRRRAKEGQALPDILDTVRLALGLLLSLDTTLLHVIALSLAVSLSAAVAAAVCGLPLGTALAVFRFRGRHLLILLANALLGLPPVVVGLALYLLLSRSGPLGALGILFTPTAMVVAQFLLALPIVVALSHRAMEAIWRDYGDDLLVSGRKPVAGHTSSAVHWTAGSPDRQPCGVWTVHL